MEKIPLKLRVPNSDYVFALLVVANQYARDMLDMLDDDVESTGEVMTEATIRSYLCVDVEGNDTDPSEMDAVELAEYLLLCQHYGVDPNRQIVGSWDPFHGHVPAFDYDGKGPQD